MPWFKVDDGFYDNPKVKSIPRRDRMACLGLWITAGTWSAKHLTDGRIPAYMVEEFGADVSHGDILAASGLWRRDGDDYVFHDWHDWQPTRVDTLASREKERLRKEAYRAKKAGNTGQSPDGTQPDGANASQDPDPTRPDPTRPSISNEIDPSLSPDESDDLGSLIPAEWRPKQSHIDKAKSLHLDVKNEYQRFRADAERKQRRMKKWDTGFTNWLRKAAEFNQQRQGSKPSLQTFAQQRDANALALVNSYAQEEQREQIGDRETAHLRALDSGR